MADTMKSLVKKAKKGDSNAFSDLMELVKIQAYKMAFSYVKNEDDALDIVSDSVYKAYRSIGDLQKPEYFTTWFMRIVINSAISFLKKQQKVTYIDQYVEDINFSTKDEDLSSIQRIDLYEALDTLTPDQKTIILLRFYQDMKIDEIAEFLQIPLSTAKTRLYSILSILKKKMGEVYDHEYGR